MKRTGKTLEFIAPRDCSSSSCTILNGAAIIAVLDQQQQEQHLRKTWPSLDGRNFLRGFTVSLRPQAEEEGCQLAPLPPLVLPNDIWLRQHDANATKIPAFFPPRFLLSVRLVR